MLALKMVDLKDLEQAAWKAAGLENLSVAGKVA